MARSKDRKTDRDYQRLVAQETLVFQGAEVIADLLERQGITRQELARRLGKSKGFVTHLLSGKRNMTLRTLGDLGFALGNQIQLSAAPLAGGSATPQSRVHGANPGTRRCANRGHRLVATPNVVMIALPHHRLAKSGVPIRHRQMVRVSSQEGSAGSQEPGGAIAG